MICSAAGLFALLRRVDREHLPLLLYFVCAWGLALVQLLHIGSDVNALLEAAVITAIIAALGVSRLSEMHPALLVTVASMVIVCVVVPETGLQRSRDISVQLSDMSRIAKFASGRKLLADAPYVEARSAEPMLLDPYFSSLLENDGVWKSTAITQQIRDQQFDAVLVTYHERFPQNYRGIPVVSSQLLLNVVNNYRADCEFPLKKGYSRIVVWLPARKAVSAALRDELRAAGCGPRTIYKRWDQ
jgi:hypothetical protein